MVSTLPARGRCVPANVEKFTLNLSYAARAADYGWRRMDHRRRIAVVLTGLALLAAGCGGDKPAPPAPPDRAADAGPGPSRAVERARRARAEAEEIAWR